MSDLQEDQSSCLLARQMKHKLSTCDGAMDDDDIRLESPSAQAIAEYLEAKLDNASLSGDDFDSDRLLNLVNKLLEHWETFRTENGLTASAAIGGNTPVDAPVSSQSLQIAATCDEISKLGNISFDTSFSLTEQVRTIQQGMELTNLVNDTINSDTSNSVIARNYFTMHDSSTTLCTKMWRGRKRLLKPDTQCANSVKLSSVGNTRGSSSADIAIKDTQGSSCADIAFDDTRGSSSIDIAIDDTQGSSSVDIAIDDTQGSSSVDMAIDDTQGSSSVDIAIDDTQGSSSVDMAIDHTQGSSSVDIVIDDAQKSSSVDIAINYSSGTHKSAAADNGTVCEAVKKQKGSISTEGAISDSQTLLDSTEASSEVSQTLLDSTEAGSEESRVLTTLSFADADCAVVRPPRLSDEHPFLSSSAAAVGTEASFTDERSVAMTTEMASHVAPADVTIQPAPTVLTTATAPIASVPDLNDLSTKATPSMSAGMYTIITLDNCCNESCQVYVLCQR